MAVVLARLLVAFFVVVAIAQGIGNPSVPSGDVAVVEDAPDGDITPGGVRRGAGAGGRPAGVPEGPAAVRPAVRALRDAAMSDLLLGRWVRGEAEERGITVSDSEISNRLDRSSSSTSAARRQFQKFLKQAHFTPEQARDQVELQLLERRSSRSRSLPAGAAGVSEAEIEDFYDANKAQFEQPETRDVRQIVNKDQAKVEQAKALLEQDDSAGELEEGRGAVLHRRGDQGQRRPASGRGRGPERAGPRGADLLRRPRESSSVRSRGRRTTT